MEIKDTTVDRITNYMVSKPRNEVDNPLHEIFDQIRAVQNEAARVAEEAKVKAIEARLAAQPKPAEPEKPANDIKK